MAISSAHQRYINSLMEQVEHVPGELAAEVAVILYTEFVYATAIDSGQAVLNWGIAYDEDTIPKNPELLWGYGQVEPTGLAGYKRSNGANEALRTELATYMLDYTSMFGPGGIKATDFFVYNKIEPGAFPNFAPGDDSLYAGYAFSKVEDGLASIISQALDRAEDSMVQKYSFLKKV